MYSNQSILDCFRPLVGWQNSVDPEVDQITDPTLLESDSGRHFRDFHPLLKTDVISNIMGELEDINLYLRERTDSAILDVFKKFANYKKELQTTKTILNSSAMFDGVGNRFNSLLNESKFVGFRLVMKPSYGVSVIINDIGFDFTEAQTNLPIRLFHTSQIDPIKTVTGTTIKGRNFQWLQLSEPIDISYYNNLYDTGGQFYLGYYQDDILGQALNKDFNWGSFCGGCNGHNKVKVWNTRLDFLEVRPMYVANGNYTLLEMFDYRNVVITDSKNYGLNLKTTITCDLSDYFCDQKILFAEAIGIQMAIQILNEIVNCDRSNRISEVTRNMAIRALEGDVDTHNKGLKTQLAQEIKSLNFDFSKIDSPCLPSARKATVQIGAI